jgi:hypothetical protein
MAEDTKVIAVEKDGSAMNMAALMSALNNSRNNPAEMLAILNNNGIGGNAAYWFIFMMMMWGWGGNGFRNGGNATTQIEDQINAIRTQINNNSNTDLLNQAIQGNTAALQQLAMNLGQNYTAVSTAICGVQNAISQVGGKVDFNAERTINAFNIGNSMTQNQLGMIGGKIDFNAEREINAFNQGMCGIKTTLLEGFGEDRLKVCEQTNAITKAIAELGNNLSIGMQGGFNNLATQVSQGIQRIVDGQTQQTIQALRDKNFEWSQKAQTAEIINAIPKGTTTAGA